MCKGERKLMRQFILAAALLGLATPAYADRYWDVTESEEFVQVKPSQYREEGNVIAGRPSKPARSWEGAYIGLNISKNDGETTNTNGNNKTSKFKDDGAGFGGQVGYNWQTGIITYGVEGDFTGLDTDGNDGENLGQLDEIETNWASSARARVGLALGPVMPYVTGGWAWENSDYTITDFDGSHTETATLNGPTVGGGVEVALSNNTSAKVEYRHTKLENGSLWAPELGDSSRDYDRDVDTVMLGLNYRFTGPTGRYY